MEHTDFRNYFVSSYFAFTIDYFRKHVSLNGNPVDAYCDSQGCTYVPCTRPSPNRMVGATTMMAARALYRDRANGQMTSSVVEFPWEVDMDEDPNVMNVGTPDMGYITTNQAVVYLRLSPRQNRPKGYVPDHVYATVPNPLILSSLGEYVASDTPEVIISVYNRRHLDFDAALLAMQRGERIGASLSNFLAVAYEKGYKYPMLFYRGNKVGFVENGDPCIYDRTSPVIYDYVNKILNRTPRVK